MLHRRHPLEFLQSILSTLRATRRTRHPTRTQRTLLRGRRNAETALCRRAPDESLKGLYYFSVLDDMVVSGVWGMGNSSGWA
jgi:hypothetical protein